MNLDEKLDKIELKIVKRKYPLSEEVIDAVDIIINDRNLIDMLKEVESGFEEVKEKPLMAGSYSSLMPIEFYNFFISDNSFNRILGCGDCGEIDCWPMEVKVVKNDKVVIWTDFAQPYRRNWNYQNLGTFNFDRKKYDEEINKVEKYLNK